MIRSLPASTLLVSGCLYTEPAWREDVNQPPEILSPTGPPGTEFIHDLQAAASISVVASDTDSERIQCFWIVPGLPPPVASCEVLETGLISTHVTLDQDPGLDGLLVEAHIRDVDADVDVVVLFRLVFPGQS